MINDILANIGTYIAGRNPTYNTHFTGSIQLEEGEIVRFIDGEGQYQGLSDTNANYFYIRYLNDITAQIVTDEDRVTPCDEHEYNVPLRLVSWVFGGDSDKVSKALIFDLQHYSLSGLRYYSVKPLQVNKVMLHPEKIFKEETLLEKPDGQKRLSLVAIDFTVSVRVYLNASCVDRNFCETEC